MITALLNARVLTPEEEVSAATVIVEEGRIAAVGQGLPPPATPFLSPSIHPSQGTVL